MPSIRDRIINSPELQAARAARDLDALAAGLNAQGLTEIGLRLITMRTIASESPNADAIISALKTAASASPSLAEMLYFMRDEAGMNIGHPNAQAKVDALVALGAMTPALGAELKGMALRPVIVTRDQVEHEMYNPDGTEK